MKIVATCVDRLAFKCDLFSMPLDSIPSKNIANFLRYLLLNIRTKFQQVEVVVRLEFNFDLFSLD